MRRINPRQLEAAEGFWELEMASVRQDLRKDVSRRYRKSGLTGLQRRVRTLTSRKMRPREYSELFLLNDAINTLTTK
ncbi:hypothetical protein [Prauserella alba]|uniref:Uncharacterized protein n=1 Tax=Prauserella alba TaxID=176898 RepID=A0ABP4G1B3_9PSEU|nr:hypothetical protein [Prauserella alba]MCP2180032.1 hypothetical protein [Prauserella alba]